MKKLIPFLIGFSVFSILLTGMGFVANAACLTGSGGGTGICTASSTSVGQYLQVASTSPFLTYQFASSSGGSGGLASTSPFPIGGIVVVSSSGALSAISSSTYLTTSTFARAVTKVVCASNAIDTTNCDYRATGVDDGVIINTALQSVASSTAGAGTVYLSAGSFFASTTVAWNQAGVRLIGAGIDSTLIFSSSTSYGIHVGNRQAGAPMLNYAQLSDLGVYMSTNTSTAAIFVDGTGRGSVYQNLIAQGDANDRGRTTYGFVDEDVDRTSFNNIYASGGTTAQIANLIGKENTFGNAQYTNIWSVLSFSTSTGILWGYDVPNQSAPSGYGRVVLSGWHTYAPVNTTGSIGMAFNVGGQSMLIEGGLGENNNVQVQENATSTTPVVNATWLDNQFINNGIVSTDIFQFNTYNHNNTYEDDTLQQATNAFDSKSGFPNVDFEGKNSNQGNITNLFAGSFSSKTGSDSNFCGSNNCVQGLNSTPYANTFSTVTTFTNGGLALQQAASGTLEVDNGNVGTLQAFKASMLTATSALIQGTATTTNLTITGLGSSGSPCLSVGSGGAVATTTCGTGGSSALTSTYVGVGNVSNSLAGSASFTATTTNAGTVEGSSGDVFINLSSSTGYGVNIYNQQGGAPNDQLRIYDAPASSTATNGAQILTNTSTLLTVNSTAGFPSSGVIEIQNQTSRGENSFSALLIYTTTTATTFAGSASAFYNSSLQMNVVSGALVYGINTTANSYALHITNFSDQYADAMIKFYGPHPDLEFAAQGYNAPSGTGQFAIDIPVAEQTSNLLNQSLLRFDARTLANDGFNPMFFFTGPGATNEGKVCVGGGAVSDCLGKFTVLNTGKYSEDSSTIATQPILVLIATSSQTADYIDSTTSTVAKAGFKVGANFNVTTVGAVNANTLNVTSTSATNGISNTGNVTTTNLTATSLTSGLALTSATGVFSTYGGASACSAGQAVTTISAVGGTTCAAFLTTANLSGTNNFIPIFTGANTVGTSTLSQSAGTTFINGTTAIIDGGGDYIANVIQSGSNSLIVQNPTSTTSVGNLTQSGGVLPITTSTSITGAQFLSGGFFNDISTSTTGTTTVTLPTLGQISTAAASQNASIWASSFAQQFLLNSSTINLVVNTSGTSERQIYSPGTPSVLSPGQEWFITGQFENSSTVLGATSTGTNLVVKYTLYQTSTLANTFVYANANGQFVATSTPTGGTGTVTTTTAYTAGYLQEASSSLAITNSPVYSGSATSISIGTTTVSGIVNVVNASGTSVLNLSSLTGATSSAVAFGVKGNASTSPAAPVNVFQILSDGHLNATGTTPTMGTCGGSPTVTGSDAMGTISVGSGVVTSCAMNFQVPMETTNYQCIVTDNSAAISSAVTAQTTSTVTFGTSATLGGGKIFYVCGMNL